MLMIWSAFLTVFQSFLSLMEDTMAHSPCQNQQTQQRIVNARYYLIYLFNPNSLTELQNTWVR